MQINLSLLVVVIALLCYETFGAAPTRAPTRIPTKMPTRNPTKSPTIVPTRNPTRTPTRTPTRSPTVEPTFKPSTKPTQKPTFSPTTHTPTVAPTCDPTMNPTPDPTVSPTETPTADPTFTPTYDPTVNPTETPTADPTANPTVGPTNEPTIPPPSAKPTFRPTLNPAATRAPTARPTNQVSPVVIWYTNITLDGVAQPTLDEDCVKVLVRTVAELAKLPTDAVKFLGSGPATINIPQRRLLGGIHDQTFHFTVFFRNSIALAATNFDTAFAVYNHSMHYLEDAVHHGDFDYRIQENAVTYGTPDLFDASSFMITDSYYVESPPPAKKEENLDLTEGGVAIIVICCLVMFFVFCYMAWDHSRGKHDKPQEVEHATKSAPQGYVAAEDEDEETVINKL